MWRLRRQTVDDWLSKTWEIYKLIAYIHIFFELTWNISFPHLFYWFPLWQNVFFLYKQYLANVQFLLETWFHWSLSKFEFQFYHVLCRQFYFGKRIWEVFLNPPLQKPILCHQKVFVVYFLQTTVGIAIISFDLSPVFVCPRTRLCSEAKADIICICGISPFMDRRSVFHRLLPNLVFQTANI